MRQWLGALIDYDEGRGAAEMVLTLSRHLECGGNHDATASALKVHRSTLRYRLQRIREISGLDLGDPQTAFNLQLASRPGRPSGGAGRARLRIVVAAAEHPATGTTSRGARRPPWRR